MEFTSQINKFQTAGLYNYKFDEAGNVISNSASADFSYHYLSLPLLNSVYDNKAIASYYDINFSEFVIPPTKPDATISINSETTRQSNQQLVVENEQLKTKINDLVILSESDSSVAKNDAIKRVILDLRISLKEGKEDRDFSDSFPYTIKSDK